MSEKNELEKIWPAQLTPSEEQLIRKTVEKHKRCWGTGRVGFKNDTGAPIPCSCVWKAWGQIMAVRAHVAQKEKVSEPV